MCLVAFAIGASPHWPLVIASNRDEFLVRPTLPLARWQGAGGQTVVSGRDALAGGTWLGATDQGRVALLTNVREPLAEPGTHLPRSRGELVMRWLEGDMDATEFMRTVDSSDYAGFNLVLGQWSTGDWTWASNRGEGLPRTGWRSSTLQPGVYGLSNAALDTPWPKTLALKQVLASVLAPAAVADSHKVVTQAAFSEDLLWAALANQARATLSDLPSTGVPPALESALSSVFVDAPERSYGTRSSTLLVVSSTDGAWTVRIKEKTYNRIPASRPGKELAPINWNADRSLHSMASQSLKWPPTRSRSASATSTGM